MSVYFIAGTPPIRVEIEGVPPCLWCGQPVTSPSMDGPLVCPACDCGRNADGTRWTHREYEERRRHFAERIEEYRQAAANVPTGAGE